MIFRKLTPSFFLGLAMTVAACRGVCADEPRVQKDIEFANVDGHSLKLDLHQPAAGESKLVVWIHGGGWRSGSKDRCPVTWLTGHGYSVASISYRLTDKATFPAQIHDCKAAVRWLRANAEKFGYSTNWIVVAGSSAGGHLAALMGTSGDVADLEGTVGGNFDQSSRVDAVVDFYGATDFVLRSKTQPSRANKEGSVVYLLLGGGADQKVELAKAASAAFHVTPDDPPFLILHGDKDNKVLLDQSQRIVDVYQKAGLPITLHVLEGSGHGGDEFYQGDRRRLTVEFLKQHLGN
jgi:acetyl esterase/lipase